MSTDTSKHWKCSVCLKLGGGQVCQAAHAPYASIPTSKVPDELKFHVQISGSNRRTLYHVCSQECEACLFWPNLYEDAMLDFVCFMDARNIVSNTRESLESQTGGSPTLAAFEAASGLDLNEGTMGWIHSLQEFYIRAGEMRGLEPVYSIEPERDPAPKIFLAAFQYLPVFGPSCTLPGRG